MSSASRKRSRGRAQRTAETNGESAKRRRSTYEAKQSAAHDLKSIAGQTLKKLAGLTCSVCEDSYTDPKLLPCSHIFCEPCLEEMVYQDQERPYLFCPACQRSATLPLCGTAGIPPAFYVQRLIKIQHVMKKAFGMETQNGLCEKCNEQEMESFCYKCDKFLCKQCISLHEDWEELSTHERVGLQQVIADARKVLAQAPTKKLKTLYCSKHPRKKLDMFCETDEELVCQECSESAHWYHQCNPISEAVPKLKSIIASNLKAVKKQEKDVAKEIKDLDARKVEIEVMEESVRDHIQETFQELHQALEEREKEVMDDLEHTTEKKMNALSCQREDLKIVESQLSSCLQFVRTCQEAGTSSCVEMITKKQHVQIQVEEMSARAYSVQNVALEEANIAIDSCMLSKLKQITEIVESPLTVASVKNTTAHRDRKSRVVADCQVSKLVLFDYRHSGRSNTAENEQSVVCVERPVTHYPPPFGTLIRTITDLNGPWGVTVNRKGQVIVAEFGGDRVSIYNRHGKKVNTIGSKGSLDGHFKEPRDVASDSNGNILVTDGRNHRIQKFTPSGKFLNAVGTEQSDYSTLMPLHFACPVGIHIDQSDKVYVCDQKNNRVQVLNSDLTFSHSLSSGTFQDPWGVAQDSCGNVYVTDNQNHTVKVFTEDGKFLRKIGSLGRSRGQLTHPSGICIDSNDIVYVTERDRETSRVSIFKNDGQFLLSFGSYGEEPGEFREPRGIAVDKNGLIYVTERDNGRLQIFSGFENSST